MDTIKKVKISLFMLDLIFEIIVNSVILVVAWFSNRLIETLLFYFIWRVFRYAVPKVFHIKVDNALMSVIGCGVYSILCYVIAIRFMLPLEISLFWNVILGAYINYILYLIAVYRDYKHKYNQLIIERAKNTIDIYKMNEEDLRNYCKSKNLSEMIIDTVVLRVIHNYKWVDIAKERNYTKDGIRYHKERIKKQLNIKL